MRYYIIAGEASGDLHASRLIHHLRQLDQGAEIRAWGGDLMQKAGAVLVKHYRDLAFMGFVEVALHIRTIWRNLAFCQRDITAFQPDVVIFVDYPGFNLRIAHWAKREGWRTCYYISPQLWAWHSSRAYRIRDDIDRMFVILPFEPAFYQRYGYAVDYVGHPLLDAVTAFQENPSPTPVVDSNGKQLIALLPGSRKQEVQRMLDLYLDLIPMYPAYRFVIAAAPSLPLELYREIIARKGHPEVELMYDRTYDLLHQSSAAVVTSGTATLETALFKVPQVVCYKGGRVSFLIARALVHVKYISLVNLILDHKLVTELIQSDCRLETLSGALSEALSSEGRSRQLQGYETLWKALGQTGASERTARHIWQYLQSNAGK